MIATGESEDFFDGAFHKKIARAPSNAQTFISRLCRYPGGPPGAAGSITSYRAAPEDFGPQQTAFFFLPRASSRVRSKAVLGQIRNLFTIFPGVFGVALTSAATLLRVVAWRFALCAQRFSSNDWFRNLTTLGRRPSLEVSAFSFRV